MTNGINFKANNEDLSAIVSLRLHCIFTMYSKNKYLRMY